MGARCNELGATSEDSHHPTSPGMHSPLDLSRNSTTYAFIHPPTPDKCSSASPMDVGGKSPFRYTRQRSRGLPLPPPEILIEPKSEWHYRNMKDLAIQHIPLLSGIGPQRTPIRLRVPARSEETLYICIEIVTVAGKSHPSKVIVPSKTSVNADKVTRDNNLDCLKFDECDPSDTFHPSTRCIYSKVSSNEHQLQYKDIRVHMFNLYQSQVITKEVIQEQELHLCQLSFRFCYRSNNGDTCLSERSLSAIITEKKNNKRASNTESAQESMSIDEPYSKMRIHSPAQESTDKIKYGAVVIIATFPLG